MTIESIGVVPHVLTPRQVLVGRRSRAVAHPRLASLHASPAPSKENRAKTRYRLRRQGQNVTPGRDDVAMKRRPGPSGTRATTGLGAVERALDGLARPRLGAVSTTELRQAGIDDDRREHALNRGTLIPIGPRVYRAAGVSLTREAELRAACASIGPHAVVSHRSSLRIWRLIDNVDTIEVTVPLGRRCTIDGLTVHRSTDLADPYCGVRRGVPVTTPARSLLDAAAVLAPAELEQAVEGALSDRLVSVAGLRTILHELGRPGRRGAGRLRLYLDRRALADARPESRLEPVMARVCRDHGVGPVLYQANVVLDGKTYRPDFQVPEALLAVEVDGFDAHRSRAAFDHDLTRQNAFIRHDWLVLRYTSSHMRRPAKVANEIIAVARRRRAELGTPAS